MKALLKQRSRRAIKATIIASLLLSLLGALLYGVAPKPELKTYVPYSTAYYDSDQKLLRLTLTGDQKYRLYESLDNISPEFIEATILYEDQNFYQHFGVDLPALVRAFWSTYVTAGRRVGASTIVMQVARLRWNIHSKNLSGKLTQILRAIQLTRHYSKQELLQAYFNLAPYGRNIEGIGAASVIYFNKPASQLSLPEALTLAVIPQNPAKRNPTSEQGVKKLVTARQNLFERWRNKYPQAATHEKFLALPLKVRSPEALPFHAPHFVQYVEQQRSNWEHGRVLTSLSLSRQEQVEKVLKNYVQRNQLSGLKNASALLVNYKTMHVEAMVGSADFYDPTISGQVNGTNAKRSPGSTLKPLVYALALDEGLIHPKTLLKDSAKRYAGFTPENYDKKFLGPVSAAEALVLSRNVPAVELQAKLSKRSFYKLLQQANISELKPAEHYGLALALGGGEVTAIELAQLYAMLANHGQWSAISYLQSDRRQHTQQVTERHSAVRSLLSPEASFLILDILKDNPPAIAKSPFTAELAQRDIAWKTGTSWAFRDAWAVGVSGDYVLVVWVGNFSGKGNAALVGRSAAGPLFFDIFSAISEEKGWKLTDYYQPHNLNLKRLTVCNKTGDLFEQHCPQATTSWFIPGVSPVKVSNIYRAIPIDKNTGLRACWHDPQATEMQTFEFWPSDIKHIFAQAGVNLKDPPPYAEECQLNHKSAAGVPPEIYSPSRGVKYVYRHQNGATNRIALSARADSQARLIHWFIDSNYVGSAKVGEPLFWRSKPGQFTVKAVDDFARTSESQLTVVGIASP